MDFYISDTFTSGSGMNFKTKDDFLNEVSKMVDDCIANGGTHFDITVDSDASCFNIPDYDEEERLIDEEYHDYSEDELRKMGVFDNLNDDDFDISTEIDIRRMKCQHGYFGEAEGFVGTGYFCRKKNCFVTGMECLRCNE